MKFEILIIGYLIGFFISLISLHLFGDKLNIDYDEPKTYANMDDWGSNAEAYLGWSFFWFIILFGVFFSVIWGLGLKLSKYIGENVKTDN